MKTPAKRPVKYPERESRTLEFKELFHDYRKLARTAVAFANGIGGTIIVGVRDETLEVVGLDELLIDKYFEEVPRAVFQIVTPNLMVHPFEKNYEGRSLFGINVYPGDNKPYYLTSEGKTKGIYVRIGSHTMRANEQFIEELRLQRENRAYDEMLVRQASLTELNQKLIQEQFNCRSTTHLLESNRIVGRDHVSGQMFPTIGGIVMFHPSPSSIIPEVYISCARMRGASGRNIIETHDFEGPLPQITQSVIEQVENWLERDLTLDRSKLKGKLLVPHEALREGIYNAVFHRKYNIPGPIKITLWANRLEIFSPGHFVGLMNLEHLGDGTTYIRNRVICAIARKIRLMEKRGTGIRLIIESCKREERVMPVYEEGADWVKLTFKFLSEEAHKSLTIKERFDELLKRSRLITNRDVVSVCGVSRETANAMVKREVARGRLRQDGSGRSTRYWVLS